MQYFFALNYRRYKMIDTNYETKGKELLQPLITTPIIVGTYSNK